MVRTLIIHALAISVHCVHTSWGVNGRMIQRWPCMRFTHNVSPCVMYEKCNTEFCVERQTQHESKLGPVTSQKISHDSYIALFLCFHKAH